MLAKLLPLIIVTLGFATTIPTLKAELAKTLALPRVLQAQQSAFDLARRPDAQPQNATEKTRVIIAGPYAKDPWDQPFKITYLRKRFELVVTSVGPDGLFDTADDIRARHPIGRPRDF